jgi:hypothetical protein
MKKIFFIILFIGTVGVLLGRMTAADAADSCNCTVKINGIGCTINSTKAFVYGKKLMVADLEAAIDWSKCSLGKTFASGYLDNYKQYEQIVTADLCSEIAAQNNKGVYDAGIAKYDYEFSCIAAGVDGNSVNVGGEVDFGGKYGANDEQKVSGQSSDDGEQPQWPEEVPKYLNRVSAANINVLIGRAIGVIVGLVGSIALAVFVYAGLTWMLSMDSDRKGKAVKTLVWSSLGLIVIMASYAAVSFIFNMIK